MVVERRLIPLSYSIVIAGRPPVYRGFLPSPLRKFPMVRIRNV